MSRLPAATFATLAVATVAAFFVTQHLKVTTPLIAGVRGPTPRAINPYGARCGGLDHEAATISFYLLHRSDTVAVYVVDAGGTIVRTLAASRHMRRGVRHPDGDFTWNGREQGGNVAPDGTYLVRVALLGQGRTVTLSDPGGRPLTIAVRAIPPHPVVTDVAPSLIPQRSSAVGIRYAGTEGRSGVIRVYRTDDPQRPRLVGSFRTAWGSHHAVWDGLIRRRPAPEGTYLIGLDVPRCGVQRRAVSAAAAPATRIDAPGGGVGPLPGCPAATDPYSGGRAGDGLRRRARRTVPLDAVAGRRQAAARPRCGSA